MEELVKINENEKGDILINGRELHQFLEVKTKYIDWVNRMLEYGFEVARMRRERYGTPFSSRAAIGGPYRDWETDRKSVV